MTAEHTPTKQSKAKQQPAKQLLQSAASETALSQAAMLWGLGDWPSLLAAAENWNPEHNSALAAYKIAALLQNGDIDQVKAILAASDFDVIDRQLLSKLLIAGVLNSLGKARACSFEHARAQQLFEQSVNIGLPYTAPATLLRARASTQLAQLGLPNIQQHETAPLFNPDTAHFLQSATAFFQDEPALELALADYYQREQRFDQAIVHWQQVSAMLEKDTPQPYYERLKEAYRNVKGFPLGSVEQETLRGDIDKHKLLAAIHAKLEPEFYFEIGVQTGKSLALAKCEALGVDPMPLLNVELSKNAKVITASSDAFFAQKSDMLLSKQVDLAFIDGMHLFEYALRDFINTERHLKPCSLIVIDDIYPGHIDQANRDRCTRAWTGDVWKVKAILQQFRPDLVMLAVDAYPTGLLLITALDPDNTQLEQNYSAIVQEYLSKPLPQAEVVQRDGAVSGKNEQIFKLIDLIKQCKKQGAGAKVIQEKWLELYSRGISQQ
ncbi:hypothetical protein J2X32_002681 [Rheinheimera pacifica]|uniref:class I SAM-dependent methyltransferase n=1 Tax=Rheinheimera pacifica TaxID=173990 RepID=UPI0028553A32|nr:class I SAM-dependent methyltransferase [Rheinheimera pacifica]MDR6984039.1 hypothetical protein [Rheinheimera pacifica]